MNFSPVLRWLPLVAACVLAGCQPKEATPLQRKEAASLASEGEFALTVKDFARAETLLTRATTLDPAAVNNWMNLASARKRLGQTGAARKAYESALAAQRTAYKNDPTNTQLLLDEVYVLALLGKMDDARAKLKQAAAEHGNDPQVKNFTTQALDALVATPEFKALAL